MIISLTLMALTLAVLFLTLRVNKIIKDLKFHREAIEYKLVGESSKLLEDVKEINTKVETIQYGIGLLMVNFEKLNNLVPKTEKPLAPANRNARTEESKRLQSEKKKEWWAKKRAEEELKKTLPTSPATI